MSDANPSPHCSKCCPVKEPEPAKNAEWPAAALVWLGIIGVVTVAAFSGVLWLLWQVSTALG